MAVSPVYTSRVWSANLAQGVANDSEPVASGARWVVRDLILNGGATAGRATIWIISGSDATVLWNGQLPAGESVHIELRQAVYAGESLRGHSAETAWSVLATAYVLSDTVWGNSPQQ